MFGVLLDVLNTRFSFKNQVKTNNIPGYIFLIFLFVL